jgi:hypothetical protein
VALLSTLRFIVLLGLIATLSAFSVLHFGLQEYRVQSLWKGRDRQCKTHPKHATSAELVKIAHQFSTAVRFDEECAMPNARITSLRMIAPCKSGNCSFQQRSRAEEIRNATGYREFLGRLRAYAREGLREMRGVNPITRDTPWEQVTRHD